MPDERTEALLAAYLDDALSPDEAAQMQRRLASNPRQRRMVDEMRQAKTWLGELPRMTAPAGLLDAIDPSLERAALFEVPPAPRPWWATPQALAVAATLVLLVTLAIVAVALLPGKAPDADRVAVNPLPAQPPATRPEVVTSPDRPESLAATKNPEPAVSAGTVVVPPALPERTPPLTTPLAVPDKQIPVPSTKPAEGDDGGADVPLARPVFTVPPPAIPENAVLVRADVDDLSRAGADVARLLANQSLPIIGGRLADAAALPEEFVGGADVRPDAATVLYVVPEARLDQAGAVALTLANQGSPTVARLPESARALRGNRPEESMLKADAAALDMKGNPRPRGPANRDAQRVFFDDTLQIYVFRGDEPPAQAPAGVPDIRKTTDVRVDVSPDGYIDLSGVGLGRVDVLGQDVKDLGAAVEQRIKGEFLIPVTVTVNLAGRARSTAERSAATLERMQLDRRPLVPGDLVQIDRPDGTWQQAVVNAAGELTFGDLGTVATRGESAASLQTELRRRLPSPPVAPAAATQPAATAPAATAPTTAPVIAPSLPPLRVQNLSARRRGSNDPTADKIVPVVILLQSRDPAAQPPAQPATRPADAWDDLK